MKNRIQLLDAMRGLGLAGICLVHFTDQYLVKLPPTGMEAYARHGTLDMVLDVLSFILIRGKGYAVFSFMFGVSFALQLSRSVTKDSGRRFHYRFAWRLALLLGIGYAHSFVYHGDILSTYALLGFPLLLMGRVRGRWLLFVAAVLLLGAPRIFVAATHSPMTMEVRAEKATAFEAQAMGYWDALQKGDIREMARRNISDAPRMWYEIQFGVIGRGYQTLAYFLLGLWAGRRRLLEDVENHLTLFRRTFRWAGIATLAIPLLATGLAIATRPAGGWYNQSQVGGMKVLDPANWIIVAGITVYDLWNLATALFFLAAFVLLFRRERWQRRMLVLAPVGKLALSNYVLQSFVGAFVFYGYGLGLLGKVGSSITLPLGLAVFTFQIWASRLWLRRFEYGPLEWLWRSLTQLRRQPFRRTA